MFYGAVQRRGRDQWFAFLFMQLGTTAARRPQPFGAKTHDQDQSQTKHQHPQRRGIENVAQDFATDEGHVIHDEGLYPVDQVAEHLGHDRQD
ncbi:hypothetical protein D3C84_1096330 [compost metagenome]